MQDIFKDDFNFLAMQEEEAKKKEKDILKLVENTNLLYQNNNKQIITEGRYSKKVNYNTALIDGVKYDDLTLDEQEQLRVNEKVALMYKNFGEALTKFLEDETIIEIYLNQDGYLWVERFGVGREKTNEKLSPSRAKGILELVADFNNFVITPQNPIISVVLPKGERITGVIANSVNYKPIFAIRKKSNIRFELDFYVKTGVITEEHKKYLEDKILNKKNILIVGATSSGKTTFANACLKVLEDAELKKGQGDRIIVIEEVPELVYNGEQCIRFVVSQFASALDLLRSCMRLTPDRIIFGELRKGLEVIELLKAWNSGHDGGLSTVHANSAIEGLEKLEQYLGEIQGIDLNSQRALIGRAVDVVVFLEKTPDFKRKLVEIVEVKKYDYDQRKYICDEVYNYYNEQNARNLI